MATWWSGCLKPPWDSGQEAGGVHVTILWRADLFHPNMSCCSQPVDAKGQWFEKALGVQVHQMSSEASVAWHCSSYIPTFDLLVVQDRCMWTTFSLWAIPKWSNSPPAAALAQHILDMPKMQHNKWDCFFPHYGRFYLFILFILFICI